VATSWRQEFIRPSWKEKFVCCCVSVLSLVRFVYSMHGTHVHSSALKEESGLVGDQVSGKVLRCVDQAGDDCAAEIDALPEIQE
jgi:hypothetical protein